jgi:hypothetical protein
VKERKEVMLRRAYCVLYKGVCGGGYLNLNVNIPSSLKSGLQIYG